MSQQTSLLPDDEPKRAKRPGKKRHGPYEIWMRHTRGKFGLRWHKLRGYESEAVARENLVRFEAKWNFWIYNRRDKEKPAPSWEFKLRMPGEDKPTDE